MFVVITYIHGSHAGILTSCLYMKKYTQTYRPEHIHTVHSASALSSITIQNILKKQMLLFQMFSSYFFHCLQYPTGKRMVLMDTNGGTVWIGNVWKSPVNKWHSCGRFLWRFLFRGLLQLQMTNICQLSLSICKTTNFIDLLISWYQAYLWHHGTW